MSDFSSPAVHSLITGKSLTYNRQALSRIMLTAVTFNNCCIDHFVLIYIEPIAPKYQNFVWPVPLAPTVAERCGHSARTAGPSPWSTPTNTFHHARKLDIDFATRLQRQHSTRHHQPITPTHLRTWSFVMNFLLSFVRVPFFDLTCCPRYRRPRRTIDRQPFDVTANVQKSTRQLSLSCQRFLTHLLPDVDFAPTANSTPHPTVVRSARNPYAFARTPKPLLHPPPTDLILFWSSLSITHLPMLSSSSSSNVLYI
jgi:hypothetical protein